MLKSNITSFLEYFQSLSYSKKSLKALKSRLGEFNDYINHVNLKSVTGIEYSHLLAFAIGDENTSAHVTKSRVWALKRFFQYLVLQQILPDNLAKELSYPKLEKKIAQFLSAREFQQVLSYLCGQVGKRDGLRNLIIFLLLGILGLRVSTVSTLDIADVDVNVGRLWVQEKGDKKRFMILPEILIDLLGCYLAAHCRPDASGLFLSKRGKRLSVSALQKLVTQVGKASGLNTNLHPHLFRHTAATQLCQVADIHITREVLGHWRETHTRRYVHLGSNLYAQYMRRHPFMREWQNA